ncbi:MAG: glucosamine-6-phosphate deaminase [Flavitalea sp.]
MKVIVSDTYKELSKQAAEDIIESLISIPQPLICTASGDSPARLYKEMVEKIKNKNIDISNWHFVGLDEWAGMNETDEGSCKFHLNNQFFHPLKIEKEKISFFDGRAKDLQEECNQTEDYIREHGGIDIAIVGLGMNGHIGMNEPGTSPLSRSHIAEIDPITQKTGQKYFKSEQDLSNGLTLGLATLMEVRQIILIVSGEHKAPIVRDVLEGEISEQLPASLLRNHPGLVVYLDKDAAQMISIHEE